MNPIAISFAVAGLALVAGVGVIAGFLREAPSPSSRSPTRSTIAGTRASSPCGTASRSDAARLRTGVAERAAAARGKGDGSPQRGQLCVVLCRRTRKKDPCSVLWRSEKTFPMREEMRRRPVYAITSGPGRRARTLVWAVVLSALFTPSLSAAQTTPDLKRVGIIRTTPFVHTGISMHDGEGSAYVRRDHSLWLADDSTDAIFEVARKTGNL